MIDVQQVAEPGAAIETVDTPSSAETVTPDVAQSIRQALNGLRFGEITITIHNGQVVQIDRITKLRHFRSAPARNSSR